MNRLICGMILVLAARAAALEPLFSMVERRPDNLDARSTDVFCKIRLLPETTWDKITCGDLVGYLRGDASIAYLVYASKDDTFRYALSTDLIERGTGIKIATTGGLKAALRDPHQSIAIRELLRASAKRDPKQLSLIGIGAQGIELRGGPDGGYPVAARLSYPLPARACDYGDSLARVRARRSGDHDVCFAGTATCVDSAGNAFNTRQICLAADGACPLAADCVEQYAHDGRSDTRMDISGCARLESPAHLEECLVVGRRARKPARAVKGGSAAKAARK